MGLTFVFIEAGGNSMGSIFKREGQFNPPRDSEGEHVRAFPGGRPHKAGEYLAVRFSPSETLVQIFGNGVKAALVVFVLPAPPM